MSGIKMCAFTDDRNTKKQKKKQGTKSIRITTIAAVLHCCDLTIHLYVRQKPADMDADLWSPRPTASCLHLSITAWPCYHGNHYLHKRQTWDVINLLIWQAWGARIMSHERQRPFIEVAQRGRWGGIEVKRWMLILRFCSHPQFCITPVMRQKPDLNLHG